MTLAEISQAMGAVTDLGAKAALAPERVCTDSRVAGPGQLFFCISGENFDGHNFALDAVNKGAVAVVGERPLPGIDPDDLAAPFMLVTDTVKALGMLAAHHRNKTRARVAGVTGTAGKTTVKELLAQALSTVGPTAKNHLNLNNQIGLPCSMLEATGQEEWWVMEAGISEPRDMDELAQVLRPDLGLIVNVGQAHLQGLGDVRGVAGYKSRLLAHLANGGAGLVNKDFPELVEAARENLAKGRSLEFFSTADDSVRFYCEYLGPEPNFFGSFRFVLDGEEIRAKLPLQGAFMAQNAVAAAGGCVMLGLEPEQAVKGLARAAMPEQRFVCREIGDLLVVDDSYNANPLSMASSIAAVRDMAGERPLVLVLGEMRELGDGAAEAHQSLGRVAAENGAHAVFWRGGHARDVSDGLGKGNFTGEWGVLDSPDHFLARWKDLELERAAVLFKASRSIRIEEFANALTRELTA